MSGAVIGMVGGGQLARMSYQESIPLGVDVRFLAQSPDDPVAQVAPNVSIGSPTSAHDLRAFAATVDVLTFDHEVIDLDVLAGLERHGHLLRPGATAFATVADKSAMRQALHDAGIPTPPARVVHDPDEAGEIVGESGPHVIKLAHGGYDGRGTHFVDDPAEAVRIVREANGKVLVEPRLDLVGEMAVIVVTRPDGTSVAYPPVTTIQHDGQCRRIDAPARVSAATAESAARLGARAAGAIGAVGILAVEIFVTRDGLMVNELAARPHNTGHHTLDAAPTSQFANHLRAVADLPLGPTEPATPSVTANVIGRDDRTDPRHLLADALRADPGAHIHLYGKMPRHDRKLGHVTVCDDDHERAVDRVATVVAALGGQEVPR